MYTSVHLLSPRHPSHIPRAHRHAHAGLLPPRNTILHPTPRLTSLELPRAPPAHAKGVPRGRCTGVLSNWGCARRSRVPRCMLMNSLIILTAHITPPGRRLFRRAMHSPALGPPGRGACLRSCVGSGAEVTRLPFPRAPGAQPGRSPRALCCCCACHSRKRAASSSVSMLIAPRAAGGAPGPRLRPASQAQVRLAGGQEGGITSGGRQGWAAQRTPQERTGGAPGGKSMSPKIFAKYKFAN